MTLLRGLRRTAALLVLLIVAAVLLVILGSAGRVWWTARQDDRRASDVIVVLGASQFDGRPSPVLKARLDHARDLYEGDVAPRVLTVGGSLPGDRFTEAASGRNYLVDSGVPSGDVIAVEAGSDTLTSIEAVADVMAAGDWDSAVVVTDPWHALRCRTMARDAGIDATSSPTRTGPTQGTSAAVRYVARETAAYVYYGIFGQSADGGPAAV